MMDFHDCSWECPCDLCDNWRDGKRQDAMTDLRKLAATRDEAAEGWKYALWCVRLAGCYVTYVKV